MRVERDYVPFSTVAEAFGGADKLSGLDLGPTLRWMERNSAILDKKLNKGRKASVLPTVQDHEKIQLRLLEIQNLIGLFPPESQARSITATIQGNLPLWFHKDSLAGQPQPTEDPEERLSSTAIIPGYTEYFRYDTEQLKATIHLYRIPEMGGMDYHTARIMLAEALCHEYVHTLVTPLLYSDDVLELPDGTLVDGLEFVIIWQKDKVQFHITQPFIGTETINL